MCGETCIPSDMCVSNMHPWETYIPVTPPFSGMYCLPLLLENDSAAIEIVLVARFVCKTLADKFLDSPINSNNRAYLVQDLVSAS